MSIIVTLLIIAVLILVHEWGHYIVARRIGVPVYEFSLGFGYSLWSTKRDGVLFSIRLIPLGGYVRMAGEDMGDLEDPNGYVNRRPIEKMAISVAGPLMNFIFAFLIFICSFAFIGVPQATEEPVIGKVLADKPAAQAGLQPGDRVLAVDDQQIDQWSEFYALVTSKPLGETVTIQVDREGVPITLEVGTAVLTSAGNTGIGVQQAYTSQRYGPLEAIAMGVEQTYELTKALIKALGTIVTGGASMDDVAGPVGIVNMVGDFTQMGFVAVLNFSAFLSINLGVMNLLPIPALDGARIVFAFVEMVRRKPIDKEKEGFFHWIGFLLLMFIMVLVTFNDISRLFRG